MSWASAAAPKMIYYIVHGDNLKLNAIFHDVLRKTIVFSAVSSFLLIICMILMKKFEISIVERIAGFPTLASLAVVGLVNSFVFPAATYLRAHREEPLLAGSIIMAVIMLPAAYFGSKISPAAPLILNAIVTVFVALPITIRVFMPYYKRHQPGL